MAQGLLHEILLNTANKTPQSTAVTHGTFQWNYREVCNLCIKFARAVTNLGAMRHDRIGVYLSKQAETVISMFGAAAAGAVFVPINPLLKPEQASYIIHDCGMRILITSPDRASALGRYFDRCPTLRAVVTSSTQAPEHNPWNGVKLLSWMEALETGDHGTVHRVIDTDMAAILYTSGSTGKPKGVVLSHRNMVAGARSVADYLGNTSDDRLLAVLPFSFDYGFSQLSTAFSVGARVSLLDYLLPNDVVNAVVRDHITGLAGVPPLWAQLAQLRWPAEAAETLRYITNSGGKMPRVTLGRLRAALPRTRVFLMYGLTEAFRSTYLPPEELDRRPDSIGKAIPNAEVLVVREDGSPCAVDEPGELVHRGSLVAMGYWNDPDKTAERFRPLPGQDPALVLPEIAVWSGDTVYRDAEGFLYFVGRRDDMIKTSGYRVSPTEVEEIVYATGLVSECAAIGVTHERLGQAIVIVAASKTARTEETAETIISACRTHLANFMVPSHIEWREQLPRSPNGKIDRRQLAEELSGLFAVDGQ